MYLMELCKRHAEGWNGEARKRNVVFVVPVDRYMHENLIYLSQYTKGKLDYRDYDKLSSDDMREIFRRWDEVRNSSFIYRLIAHLLEIDTWQVERGSDA